MTQTNNKPLWLVLALITLGILIVLLANMIVLDTNTDQMSDSQGIETSS